MRLSRLLSSVTKTMSTDKRLHVRGSASTTGDWPGSRVAGDMTHHVAAANHAPLYGSRFAQVLPFHAPGLAPAQLLDGRWCHIRPSGEPLAGRYLRTFGFYGERAAVTVRLLARCPRELRWRATLIDAAARCAQLSRGVWCHITADGERAYERTWAWCGNFQGGRAVVRADDGAGGRPAYRHILPDGTLLSSSSYAYAGDFREVGSPLCACR